MKKPKKESTKKMTMTKEDKVLEKAIGRLAIAIEADKHNRAAAIEDLRFVSGDQWDEREKSRRSAKGRPALTINFLPKFVDQVVGDMLHNTPSIKVRPEDSQSDNNIARIRQGIINNIEYNSNSKGIYGYAARQMVSCGYGGWRILTRYTEENPFLQEIYMEGIRNPFLIYMDPSARDQNYSDAEWGILMEYMPVDEFKDRYPGAKVPSEAFELGEGLADEHWYDIDNVTVAEYFEKVKESVIMHQLEDGRVLTQKEYDDLVSDWEEDSKELSKKIKVDIKDPMIQQDQMGGQQPSPVSPMMPPAVSPPQQPMMQPAMDSDPSQTPLGDTGEPPEQPAPDFLSTLPQELDKLGPKPKSVKQRETKQTVIRHRIITCAEILEGGEKGHKFPGKYIPLILLKGKELDIEGKNHVFSLIRNAKDSQKMINYWNTSAAETIALAPKTPWVGTAKQFEGYEKDYAAANVENFSFLKYNSDPTAPGPPQRQSPAQPPTAIFAQIQRGEENLKSVIGMFNADVGAPGSEQTGAAINARQRPGDIATFEFTENLARAIMYTGRVINDMIPEIYDTERDVRVRNGDDTETFVPINTTLENALKSVNKNPEGFEGMDVSKLRSMFSKEGKDAKYNDITIGKYGVVVTTGPSYATQRVEASQHLLQLVQALPQQMSVAADLLVKNLDFKDSDELAKRLRLPLVAQGVIPPAAGETAPQQPEDPKVSLAKLKLQAEAEKQKLQQLKLQQETVKLEHEKVKMQLEIEQLKNPQSKVKEKDPETLAMEKRRIELEEDRLNLETARFKSKAELDMDKLDHQKGMDVTKIFMESENKKPTKNNSSEEN